MSPVRPMVRPIVILVLAAAFSAAAVAPAYAQAVRRGAPPTVNRAVPRGQGHRPGGPGHGPYRPYGGRHYGHGSHYGPYYGAYYGGYYGSYWPTFSFGFHYGYPWYYGAYPYYYGHPYAYGGYPYYGGGYAGAPYGGVRIQIAQRAAEVYVGGYFAGTVDDFDGSLQQLNLEPGPHRIEVRESGFEPMAFDVYVQPGRTTTYRTAMRPVQP